MRKYVIFKFIVILSLLLLIVNPLIWGESKKLIDLDFKNADLKDVLRVLAAQEGANFIIDNEVTGSVTIHLTKITFIDALNVIAQTNNLLLTTENNVYRITQVDSAVLNVDYSDGLLTVEAKSAKLPALFKAISQKAGVNIIPAPEIQDRVSVAFNHLPVENAIETILFQSNCSSEKNGNAIYIRKKISGGPPFKIDYINNLLTVDAQNVPLANVTRAITEKTGVSVVPNQDVSMNVNIYFQDLPLNEALNVLCNSNNLDLVREGQSWRIVRSTSSQGQNVKIGYDSTNQLFDVEVQTAPITQVVSEMARKANLNLVVMAQVNWTVNNLRLQKQKFTDVLDYLLKGTVFTYKLDNDTYMIGDGLMVRPENADFSIIRVYPIKYLKADLLMNSLPTVFPRQNFIYLPDKNAIVVTAPPAIHTMFNNYLEQVDTEGNSSQTQVIRIKHLKAEDVLKYIPSSIPKNDIVVVKEINAITVTGPQNLINQVQQYVEKIDQVNPLIVFDIMVVSISDSSGLTWGAPQGTIQLGSNNLNISSGTSTGGNIGLTSVVTIPGVPATTSAPAVAPTTSSSPLASLTALVNNGHAKVISNPTITTLNGYAASFNIDTKRNFVLNSTTTTSGTTTSTDTQNIKTLDSGLTITITPWVSADNQITMEVKPKISEYTDPGGSDEIAGTLERSTETTIRVKDRETVILSGLKNNHKSKGVSKVPLLGDIPLLGYLFKSISYTDSQEEFIIVITPYLIYGDADKSEVETKVKDGFGPEFKQAINPDATESEKKPKAKSEKKPIPMPPTPLPSPVPSPTPKKNS